MFKTYFSILLFLLISNIIIKAQDYVINNNLETITFDLQKNEFPNVIPFHHELRTKVVVEKGDFPLRLFVYEIELDSLLNGERTIVVTTDTLKKIELDTVIIVSIPKYSTKLVKRNGEFYYGKIGMLKPNDRYDFYVTYGFNEKDKKELKEIFFEMYREGKSSPKPALLFKKLEERLNQSLYTNKNGKSFGSFFRVTYGLEDSEMPYRLTDYYSKYIIPYLEVLTNDSSYGSYEVIKNLEDFAMLMDYAHEYKLKLNYLAKYYDFLINEEVIDKILKGNISFYNPSQEAIDIYDFEKRLENLDTSITIIKGLITNLTILSSFDLPVRKYKKNLEQLLDVLLSNKKIIRKNITKIDNAIDRNGKLALGDENVEPEVQAIFQYGRWLSGATSIKSFKIKNGKTIVPDFGLVHILADSRIHGATYLPRPYVGFNIMLKPIDKYIVLEEAKDISGWYRWSISLGVTLGNLNKLDFSDFYNNMSLLIGTNYRIHEQVRIGGGIAFFREKHPNPIINNPRIEPGLFLSTTLDFEVLDVIPSVIGKIFK